MSIAAATVAAREAVTIPHIYSPLPTSTATDSNDSNKLPDGVTLKLYSKPTTTTAEQATSAPTDSTKDDSSEDLDLPKQFSSLSSRAPNEITRTTTAAWTASSSLISASASASLLRSHQNSKQLSSGQIAGAVVGSVAGAFLLAYVFYILCWGRRMALRRAKEEKRLREERGHRSRMPMEQQQHFEDDFDYDHIMDIHNDFDLTGDNKGIRNNDGSAQSMAHSFSRKQLPNQETSSYNPNNGFEPYYYQELSTASAQPAETANPFYDPQEQQGQHQFHGRSNHCLPGNDHFNM